MRSVGRIRIGIVPAATSVQIGATVGYDVRETGTDAVLVSGLGNEQVTVTWSSGYVITTTTGTSARSRNPPHITLPSVAAATARVLIGGGQYRGSAEVRRNAAGTLAGINDVPMEEYLYGVVPRELGPAQYPEAEAQKAQAVAARTYAHANLGKHAHNGYDLLATIADQVYGGSAAEHLVSTSAVNTTAGLIATHNGVPISALFYATSGGCTADVNDVFAGTAAYLRSVWDAPPGQELPSIAALLTDLRTPAWTGAYATWHTYHRWTHTWTMAQMSQVIGDFATKPVGDVTAINVLSRSSTSGRVVQIQFVTDEGAFTARGTAIRSAMKYINAAGTPTLLPSTLLVIEQTTSSSGAVTGYRAYGGGNGHGAGMAQTGAVGMARAGATYEQILQKYYTGIALQRAT